MGCTKNAKESTTKAWLAEAPGTRAAGLLAAAQPAALLDMDAATTAINNEDSITRPGVLRRRKGLNPLPHVLL